MLPTGTNTSPSLPQQRLNLLYAKSLFFVNTLSGSGWTKFQNNYYMERGLTAFAIGSLKSIGLFLKFFGEPFWSSVADLTDPKLIFGLSTIIQVITMEMLRRADPLTIPIVFYVKILRSITSTGPNLVTTASFQLIAGTHEGYGRQRVFGSIAWGAGAYLFGTVIDYYGMEYLFYLTYVFLVAGFLLMLVGFPTRRVTLLHDNDKQPILQRCLTSIHVYLRELKQFFANMPCRIILFGAVGFGAVMTIADTFIFISLERDYHASRSLSGWMTVVSIVSGLPIFWYSDWFIAKYGHYRLLQLSLFSCLTRLALMACVPRHALSAAVNIIIGLQFLHGINFVPFWIVAVDIIYKHAPEALTTSCMATLNMAYFTVGGSIGNAVFGWCYDALGGARVVYVIGVVVVGSFVVLLRVFEALLKST